LKEVVLGAEKIRVVIEYQNALCLWFGGSFVAVLWDGEKEIFLELIVHNDLLCG
jgi:hypothetical protein